jgi:hypothetical protein
VEVSEGQEVTDPCFCYRRSNYGIREEDEMAGEFVVGVKTSLGLMVESYKKSTRQEGRCSF